MGWFGGFNPSKEEVDQNIRRLEWESQVADAQLERAWDNYDYDDPDTVKEFQKWNEETYNLDLQLKVWKDRL